MLLDGAQGVRILSEYTAIAAEGLIEFQTTRHAGCRHSCRKSGIVRWMLLLGQLGKPDTLKEFLHKMYFYFFGQELLKSIHHLMRTHGICKFHRSRPKRRYLKFKTGFKV